MARLPFAMMSGALALTLLAGCAELEERIQEARGDGDDAPRMAAFDCDDDRDFTLRLSEDRDRARVETGGESYDLDRTGREDGRRVYSNDDGVRLEVSNEEAYLRIPGEDDFRDCMRS